jgi:hypothetical protein
MKTTRVGIGLLGIMTIAALASPLAAQGPRPEPIEVPLRVVDGRMIVSAEASDGSTYDFVLGLGLPLVTQSAVARIGDARLTIGGIPVDLEEGQTVPDSYLALDGAIGPTPAGILGSPTLNRYDLLVDVPNGRLVLKPFGRAVRWDGVKLSGSVPVEVFHDLLMRTDVQVEGEVYKGLLDLANPGLQVNRPIGAAVTDGHIGAFRMGYSGWPDIPAEVSDSPVFGRWVGEGEGFVIIGAAVAYDCVLAISFQHSEIRTCLQ